MLKIPLSTALQTFRSVPSVSSSFRHLTLSSSILARKSNTAEPVRAELPKKPMTPWVNFYTKNLSVFKKSYPTLSPPELMRKLGKEWANVPEKDKSKLQEFYKKENEAFKAEMAKVPQEQLDNIKSVKKLKNTKDNVKSAKEELLNLQTSLGKPKRPMSSYLLYCEDRRASLSSTLSAPEKMKLLGAEWRQASAKTKAVYEKKSSELIEKYNKDLDSWSMKMHNDGMNEEISLAQMRLAKAKKVQKDEA
jgi:RecG-like helicase